MEQFWHLEANLRLLLTGKLNLLQLVCFEECYCSHRAWRAFYNHSWKVGCSNFEVGDCMIWYRSHFLDAFGWKREGYRAWFPFTFLFYSVSSQWIFSLPAFLQMCCHCLAWCVSASSPFPIPMSEKIPALAKRLAMLFVQWVAVKPILDCP